MDRITLTVFGPLWVFALTVALGCGEEEAIRTYNAPKPATQPQRAAGDTDPDGGAAPGSAMDRGMGMGREPLPAGSEPPAVQWTVPEGWREVESNVSMRLATFRAGPADQPLEFAVTGFRGSLGTLLANINRWRRQLGLPPVQTPPEPVTEFHSGALHTHVFQINAPASASNNDNARSTLVAMLHGAGGTWFVKTTASPKAVTAQREALIQFARSFTLQAGGDDEEGGAP